ncbi:hypothetical protein B5S31_g3947 [[Candida] boidinii]|nr:hypothetical protein B5S31_g3947 [[Candida] boidinii]
MSEEQKQVDHLATDKESLGVPSTPRSKPFTTTVINALQKIEKGSAFLFLGFVGLHITSVVITPAIADIDTAENVLTLVREVYQSPSTEWLLVWGSLAAHVVSGFTIRMIRKFKSITSKKKKTVEKEPKTAQDETLAEPIDSQETKPLPKTPATTTPKKSFVLRYIGLSPLVIAGYLLVPMITKHAMKLRIQPLRYSGDSSLVSFEFLAHGINGKIRTMFNLSLLVFLTTFHVSQGLLKYLNIRSPKFKKICNYLVVGLTALAGLSIYNISKIGRLTGVSLDTFNKYRDSLS